MSILLSISPLGVVALHTNTLPPIDIHTLQIFVVVDVVVCFVDVVYVHFVVNLASGSRRSSHKHFAANKYPHSADFLLLLMLFVLLMLFMFILLLISPPGVVALHTNTLPPINIHTLQIDRSWT